MAIERKDRFFKEDSWETVTDLKKYKQTKIDKRKCSAKAATDYARLGQHKDKKQTLNLTDD